MRWMAALSVAIALASPAMAESPSQKQLSELGQQIFSGNAQKAQTKLEEMLLRARQTADPRGIGICELLLGMARGMLSDHDGARRHFGEARKAFTDAGDRLALSTTLAFWAVMESQSEGKAEEAVALFTQALAVIDEARQSNAPLTLEPLILLSFAMGTPEELPPFPLETIKPLILRGFAAFFRAFLAVALVEAGRLDEAEAHLDNASVDAILHVGFRDAVIEPAMGELRWRQWRFDEARDHYRKALAGADLVRHLPDVRLNTKLMYLVRLTEIELLSDRIDAALEWSHRALTLLRSRTSGLLPAALQYRASVLARGNRLDDAATVLADALLSAANQHDVRRECSIRIDLAVVEHLRGNRDSAIATLEKAIELTRTAPDLEKAARITLAGIRRSQPSAARQSVSRKRIAPTGNADARLFREAETVRLQLEALEEQRGFRSQLEWRMVDEKDLERGRARLEVLLSRLESSEPEYVSLIRAKAKR